MSLPLGPVLIGAAIGVAVIYILTQNKSNNPFKKSPLQKGVDSLEKGADTLVQGVEDGVAKVKSAVK